MGRCHACGLPARFVYLSTDGESLVCGKHYRDELEIDLEVWGESHGNFCLECDQPLHQFVLRHESLPALCVKHLALSMREDAGVAALVRAAFKEDNERLVDALLADVAHVEKERVKMERINGQKTHDAS